jgi:DNA primase small subunit
LKKEMSNSQQEFSTELLAVYYGRLFPYETMFNWFSYGNDPQKDSVGIEKDFFAKREWSFTIENDVYIRYQSFKVKF